MINRREFLASCVSVLSALSLPIFRIGKENVAVEAVEEQPQVIVRINGIVLKHIEVKEVFKFNDYYLYVKVSATEWKKFSSQKAISIYDCIEEAKVADCVEVIRDIGQNNEYECAYRGVCYYDGFPEQGVTLQFLLKTGTSTLVDYPNSRFFTSYHMLRASKLWWSQGDE